MHRGHVHCNPNPKAKRSYLWNFTLAQQVATAFRMIHLLASGRFGTVLQVVVTFRIFFSTITLAARATNFDICTIGVVVLPAAHEEPHVNPTAVLMRPAAKSEQVAAKNALILLL